MTWRDTIDCPLPVLREALSIINKRAKKQADDAAFDRLAAQLRQSG